MSYLILRDIPQREKKNSNTHVTALHTLLSNLNGNTEVLQL